MHKKKIEKKVAQIDGTTSQIGSFHKNRMLLIGLDALDWELVQAKLHTGRLPNISTIIQAGSSGPLRSLYPFFSPKLWATIATGKHAYEHGITGFVLPDEKGTGLRHYEPNLRRSPAFWNILSHLGKKTHLVGWWNTHPAEKIEGVLVDDKFKVALQPFHQPWPIDRTTVFPPEEAEKLAPLRKHPQEIPESLLRQLIPRLYEINLMEDKRVADLATLLMEDLTHLEVTESLLQRDDWDLSSVYFVGLDKISHIGLSCSEPSVPGVNPWDIYCYGEIINRGYELYDEWVGRLMKAAGEETTIMLVSDHGFYHDHRKPKVLTTSLSAPCAQHAPVGTLGIYGPGVVSGKRLEGLSLIDICPTLLAFLGISPGKDMEGNIIQAAWNSPLPSKRIASWDFIRPYHAEKQLAPPSSATTKAALQQLVALGYLPLLPESESEEELGAEEKAFVENSRLDYLLEEARAYLQEGKLKEAFHKLRELYQKSQKATEVKTAEERLHQVKRTDVLAVLASLFLALKQWSRSASLFEEIVRLRRQDAVEARALLAELSPEEGIPSSEKKKWALDFLVARTLLHEEMLEFTTLWAQWLRKPSRDLAEKMFSFCTKYREDLFVLLNTGYAFLHTPDLSAADRQKGLALLYQAARWEHQEAGALFLLGEYYLERQAPGDLDLAREVVDEGLKRNPRHHDSLFLKLQLFFQEGDFQKAQEVATSLRAHQLYEGEVEEILQKIALLEGASPATIQQHKDAAKKARKRLQKLATQDLLAPIVSPKKNSTFSKKRKSTAQTSSHQAPPLNSEEAPIIVVTGIPRSGTSLVMQLLNGAAIPIVNDQKRPADNHNPQGYWEHEKLKYPKYYHEFLEEASGKAMKIVIPLLWKLPLEEPYRSRYRILWIQRPLTEVIDSQHKMAGALASSQELSDTYGYYIEKTTSLLEERGWSFLELHYNKLLETPEKEIKKIFHFLGHPLSTAKKKGLLSIIKPSLYRSRARAFPKNL